MSRSIRFAPPTPEKRSANLTRTPCAGRSPTFARTRKSSPRSKTTSRITSASTRSSIRRVYAGLTSRSGRDTMACGRGEAVEVLGRDDELRSLEAFLDEKPSGMAVLALEGEAGIGKSTLWSAGVEAARERGMRVLIARPAELESLVAYAGLADLLEEIV